jgi:hypothetical protein
MLTGQYQSGLPFAILEFENYRGHLDKLRAGTKQDSNHGGQKIADRITG